MRDAIKYYSVSTYAVINATFCILNGWWAKPTDGISKDMAVSIVWHVYYRNDLWGPLVEVLKSEVEARKGEPMTILLVNERINMPEKRGQPIWWLRWMSATLVVDFSNRSAATPECTYHNMCGHENGSQNAIAEADKDLDISNVPVTVFLQEGYY